MALNGCQAARGGDGWAELKKPFSILSPPKCVFVHVQACVTWRAANTAASWAECKDSNQTIKNHSAAVWPTDWCCFPSFICISTPCKCHHLASYVWDVRKRGENSFKTSCFGTLIQSESPRRQRSMHQSLTGPRLWRCPESPRPVNAAPWRRPQKWGLIVLHHARQTWWNINERHQPANTFQRQKQLKRAGNRPKNISGCLPLGRGAEDRAETKTSSSHRMNHSRWKIAHSAVAAYLEY